MGEIPVGALKIVLCGDPAVGKTTLRRKFMGRGFQQSYKPTIGVDFALKEVKWENETYAIQIWDIGSQAMFQGVRRLYYKSVSGALLLFDINNPNSCDHLSDWLEEVWTYNGMGVVPVVLLGNKKDLREQRKPSDEQVDPQFGVAYAQKLSAFAKLHGGFEVKYLETSAKTGYNVEKAFEQLIRGILTAEEQISSESTRTGQNKGEGAVKTPPL